MDFLAKPEKFFVIFAFICGLLLTIFIPPLMGADEHAHLSRIYSLTEGKISSIVKDNKAGNYSPIAIRDFGRFWAPMIKDTKIKTDFKQIKKSMKFSTKQTGTYFTRQCYQTLYSPLAYLPQTVGMTFAKFFTGSIYWLLISAKLFLLAFYIALGYLAIKITPIFKRIFLLILLMPMSLSLGTSVSADGVIIPLSALFFACVFKYTFDENLKIDKKAVVLFSFLTICLALVKQSFLISLFILFIPKNKFAQNWKIYFLKLIAVLLPGLVLAILWSNYCRSWFVPLNHSNPFLQLNFILTHPFIYLLTFLKTIKLCFAIWIYMTIGVLGNNTVFLLPAVYILYIVAFVVNLYFKKDEDIVSVTLWQKILLGVLFILNFTFIATELYLSWTPPYFTQFISFIQGRYLIPLVIPLLALLGFILVSSKSWNKKIDITTLIVLMLTYLNTFLAIFVTYYF